MRSRTASVLAGVAVYVAASLASVPAHALQSVDSGCLSGFGTKVPVLMVHGLNGSADNWGEDKVTSSMYAKVAAIPDVVNDRFNYSDYANEWVTNQEIGPKLARRIDCLAQNSRAGKGTGKVIVLAFSMGGLAAQYAWSQTVAGRRVADEADFLISVATPYLGSGFGNLCQELDKVRVRPPMCQGSAIKALAVGSEELRQLLPFPPTARIKALSGDVTVKTQILGVEIKVPTFSDLMVSTDSAEHTFTEKGGGDGKRRFDCEGHNAIHGLSGAPCEHGQLLTNGDVQAEVVRSIQAYLAFSRLPVKTFYGLQLRLGPEWEIVKNDPLKDFRTVIVKGKGCNNPYRLYCPGFAIVNLRVPNPKVPYGNNAEGDACFGDLVYDDMGYGAPKEVGKATVGGVAAKRFQQQLCEGLGGRSDIMHSWRVDERGVLIYDLNPYSSLPITGLEKLLTSAGWK